MSRKSQSLQVLAYKAMPDEDRKKIRSDPNRYIEQSILESIRTEVIQENKNAMTKWASTARIPVKIQGLLIIANHFTRPDFHNAIRKIRKSQWKDDDNVFQNFGDYFDEYIEYVNERDLLKIGDDRRHHQLKKWHTVVYKTFYLLCYRRLNHIFKLHEDFEPGEGYFSEEFMKIIFELEDTEILPLVIYKLLDKNYTFEELVN